MFKILSINVRGLGGFNKSSSLFRSFINSNSDVIFMQETMVCRPSSISHFSNRWDGKSFWSPALGKQGGVAILVSKNSNLEVLSWRRDSNGRVLSLLIKSENKLINLVNIYAPVVLSDRKEFFDSLHDFFFSSSNLVIGGDFNCYDSPLDKLGGNINLQKELSDFKSDFHLIDIWRKKHPKERHFTWFSSISKLHVVWINF